MHLIMNNASALEFWCRFGEGLDEVTSLSHARTLSSCVNSAKGLKELEGYLATEASVYAEGTACGALPDPSIRGLLGALSTPLHVLTETADHRNPTSRLVCHTRSLPLPRGSLRRLSDLILIASPELCFLEMARVLPLPKLAELGCILCGGYAIGQGTGIVTRKPLSSIQKIAAFLDRAAGEPGCKSARHALRHVCEDSASPRESKVALALSLPRRMGGYGLDKPLMNHRIDLSEEEQRLCGRAYLVIDLYWPQARVGLEYDGRAYHSDALAVSHDRRKDSVLACKGITIIRVDGNQAGSLEQLYALAKKVARLTGKRLRAPKQEHLVRRAELYGTLFRSSYRDFLPHHQAPRAHDAPPRIKAGSCKISFRASCPDFLPHPQAPRAHDTRVPHQGRAV